MGKKRLIDVTVVAIEGKLEGNGTLRNVAVNDAWKRLRQNVDVKSWKEAEGVLQELSNNLQKINMLKSMSASFAKLKQTFENPDEMVEDPEQTPTNTPRQAPVTNKSSNEGQVQSKEENGYSKLDDELSGLKSALKQLRSFLDKDDIDSCQLEVPKHVSSDTDEAYKNLIFIHDKCKQSQRELDSNKKGLSTIGTKVKDLEKQVSEKQEKVDRLTATVNTLEKKHELVKEEKMGNFKDQMKQKSLERQVELKTTELTKVKDENKELKERLAAITLNKTSNTDDALNPYPTERLVEKYVELFNKERNDAFKYYKSEGKKSEAEAARKVLDILQDSFTFCTTMSTTNLQSIAAAFLLSGSPTSQVLSKLEQSELNQIQTLRKQACKVSAEYAKNIFISSLEESTEVKYSLQEITDNMGYIEKCAELCWFFSLQTPPLFINCDEKLGAKTKIDDNKYEVSSGKGSKIGFVTWPPLYAWRDGDVLRKGFVQAE